MIDIMFIWKMLCKCFIRNIYYFKPKWFPGNERLLSSVEHLEVGYAKWTWSSVLEQDLKKAKMMFQ